MKTLVSWFRSFKYLSWIVLALVVGAGILVARSLFFGPRKEGPGRLPEVPKKLQEKVAKVEEEALVAKVEARVEAQKANEVLEEVAAIDDGAERRKRLAAVLKDLR